MSALLDWDGARAAAAAAAAPLAPRTLPLRGALHAVPESDVTAPQPVPHYDSAAMDGWVVRGPGPWRLTAPDAELEVGCCAVVVTGGVVPPGGEGVVPVERGRITAGLLTAPPPAPGAHVRQAGEEAAAGDVLVPAGTRLSPAHLAVLAVAGLDAVPARPAPSVAPVLTGDEVVLSGRPPAGRVRDAFDPMLTAAIGGLGARASRPARAGDDPAAIAGAVAAAVDDVVVTVGGTGRSGADRLREALAVLGAEIVVEGVAMRPGHPALLARLGDGRPLLALPGNPLAAVVTLLTLLPPVVAGLTGSAVPPLPALPAAEPLAGWPGGTRLIPCRSGADGLAPTPAARPNMLRGLAAADVVAVVPPAGAAAGALVRCLPLPW